MKNSKKVSAFIVIGFVNTGVDFLAYMLSAKLFFNENLILASILGGTIATVMSFVLNSKVTWRDRIVNKQTLLTFFGWNVFLVLGLRPALIWIFSRFKWLYSWIYKLVAWIQIPLTEDFVFKTTLYGIITVFVMTLTFLFYEKIVFRNTVEKTSNKAK